MILIGFSNIVFAGFCLFKLKLERKAQLCMIFVLIAHAATSLLIIILLITFMFKQEFCSFYFCHQQIDTTGNQKKEDEKLLSVFYKAHSPSAPCPRTNLARSAEDLEDPPSAANALIKHTPILFNTINQNSSKA